MSSLQWLPELILTLHVVDINLIVRHQAGVAS